MAEMTRYSVHFGRDFGTVLSFAAQFGAPADHSNRIIRIYRWNDFEL
jgi:hypothetical protein